MSAGERPPLTRRERALQPFTDLGSPVEPLKSFGGLVQYLGALQVLERELYASA